VPNCINIIGSAVVFHVPSFFKEIADIEKKGIKDARDRIYVSDRCHIIFDLHAAIDTLEEGDLGANAVGTTKRGIGPCYSTKASRSGIRLADMFNEKTFERQLRHLAAGYKKRYGGFLNYDVEEEITRVRQYRIDLANYVVDAVEFMNGAQESQANILVEGSQALMLDIDYGTYPHVTSSNTCLGGTISGLGLRRRNIKEVIGVVKA
jgi:adenylosuccinate synthase